MVTPISLNGAGCAAAGLAASGASSRAANAVVFSAVFIRLLPELFLLMSSNCRREAIRPTEWAEARTQDFLMMFVPRASPPAQRALRGGSGCLSAFPYAPLSTPGRV